MLKVYESFRRVISKQTGDPMLKNIWFSTNQKNDIENSIEKGGRTVDRHELGIWTETWIWKKQSLESWEMKSLNSFGISILKYREIQKRDKSKSERWDVNIINADMELETQIYWDGQLIKIMTKIGIQKIQK